MNNVTVQSRVTPDLKAQAEQVFSGMGMSTADAIRIFLQQTVNDGGLPFQPRISDLSHLRQEVEDIKARLDAGEEKIIDGEAFFEEIAEELNLEG